MKFSGHETFHIREGWLHKGVGLVAADPSKMDDPHAHDLLGVGSNMAKSIKHWLLVLGLATRPSGAASMQLTPLGELLHAKDPYFLHPLTWWILHINLVRNSEGSTTWHWFFNYFYQPRFDRKLCVESLRRHLLYQGAKIPSWQTLDRDMACLLATYARTIPEDPTADPEESYDCPFQELGLMNFFRETGFFQFATASRRVPPHALGYVLSLAFPCVALGLHTTVPLNEAATAPNGPGKCFLASTSELFDIVEMAASTVGEGELALTGLAASRMIRFRHRSPEDWVAWAWTSRGNMSKSTANTVRATGDAAGPYLRSINIVYDADTTEGIRHFHPTAKSVELISGLLRATQDRALFVVAPYGSGKSIAATFALHLIENRPSSREALLPILTRLSKVSPDLASTARRRVQDHTNRGAVLTLHGQVQSIPEALQKAATTSLVRMGLAHHAKALAKYDCRSTTQLTPFLDTATNLFRKANIDQVAIIWDEFGRHIEDLIATGRAAELHDLQVLAEYCARTSAPPFTLAILMHQGLLRYATRLSQSARIEWTKIEGRFRTLQYVDASKQIYLLVGEIVSHRRASVAPPRRFGRVARALKAEGLFHDFSEVELEDLLAFAYPLEPTTLHLLPRISARVAQNERTLFSFLHDCDLGATVSPAALYDYFGPQMHADLSVGGTNKQWLQTESAISKCSENADAVRALKTACLLGLGLSGERGHATLRLLELALAGYSAPDVGSAVIAELVGKNLLLHRKHTDSVSLWHGTDYDLRGKLEEIKTRRGSDFDLLAFLRSQSPAPNWKTSRYNSQADVRRYFAGVYATPRQLQDEHLKEMRTGDAILDGKLVYVVAEDEAALNTARSYAKSLAHQQVVLAVPSEILPIKDTALEVQCLLDMQHDVSLLSQDPIVPIELEQMLDDSRTHLQRLLDRATRPQPAGPVWWHVGHQVAVNSPESLRDHLSTVMERVFHATPAVRNELVNRNRVSKPIVNARKKLMMGILDQTGRATLGFLEASEDHTPQASMYRTVLVNTGLYAPAASPNARWGFVPPKDLSDHGLRAAWTLLEAFFTVPAQAKAFAGLVTKLRSPPFGVRAGLVPILICAAFRAFPSATVLLRNGSYMSDLVSSDFEDVCDNPSAFTLVVLDLSAPQRQYLRQLANLFAPSAEHTGNDYDLIRRCYEALSAWRAALPPVALTASGMSSAATQFQHLLAATSRPDELFLSALPQAMGCKAHHLLPTVGKLRTVLDEMTTVVSTYQAEVERSIRAALTIGHRSAEESLFQVAASWAKSFPRAVVAEQEDLVASRLFAILDSQFENDERFVEALSLLMVGKVLIHWDSETAGRFRNRLDDLVSRVERRALRATTGVPLKPLEQQGMQALIEARIASLEDSLRRIAPRADGKAVPRRALREG